MNRPWAGLAIVAAMAAFTAVAWPHLPERIPAHWSAGADVQRWREAWPGVLRLPAWALIVWVVARVVPGAAFGAPRLERYRDVYAAAVNLVVAALALLHLLILGTALGWTMDAGRALCLAGGTVFLTLGGIVSRLPPGSIFGIRTPWSLRSAAAWIATHRLAGRTLPAGGIASMLAVFVPAGPRPWIALGALVFAGFVPVFYSFLYAAAEVERSGSGS